MSRLSHNPENKRWDFYVSHTNPQTGELTRKRFYGVNSQEGYAAAIARADDRKVTITRRRRRI